MSSSSSIVKKCTVPVKKMPNAEPSLSGVMDLLKGIKNDTKSTSDSLAQYMQTMDTRVDSLSNTVNTDSDRISKLEAKIAALEKNASAAPNSNEMAKQANLRNNICLHGIPSLDTISLDNIVTATVSALGIQLSTSDYSSVYRTSGSGSLPGFIIVKLNEFTKKLEILKAKRSINSLCLKDLNLNLQPDDQPIFVNNQLTPHFGKLLQIAKKAVSERKLHSCWIALNCLCIKPAENSDRILIRNMADLERALNGSSKPPGRDQTNIRSEVAPTKSAPAPASMKNKKRRASNETVNPAKKTTSSTQGNAQNKENLPN